MRKKIEEELAKLAFGDVSADEASRLELRTQVDQEAANTYETYRRMKDELKLLSVEVPENQLSKERLREAILTRGLKHSEPLATRSSWLWMPVAAAVLAFGAFYMKGRLPLTGSESAVVFDQPAVDASEWLPEFNISRPQTRDFDFSASNSDEERATVVSSKPASQVAMNPIRKASRIRSGSLVIGQPRESEIDVPGSLSFARESKTPPMASTFDFGAGSAAESALAPSVAGPGSGPATIIVIQSETDAATGALKATEVGDPANVLVGG